ncbi:MAG: hypothetical protein SOR95_04370 [Sutterella sp.]|nr:hypothetical protein [Sutterella sp.]
MADNPLDDINPQMDVSNLYTEELITDRKVGTIHVLTPINTDGTRDTQRPMLFLGETNLMTQMGPLPISFEIPAQNVAEAVAGYGEAAKAGIRETIERIQQMRRDAANQIVTPGMPGFQAPPSNGGGLVMP